MNPIEAEAAAALHLAQQAEHWAGRWFRHYETSAAPAAAPIPTSQVIPTGGHMSLIDKIHAGVDTALGDIAQEVRDHDAVMSNPETAAALSGLAKLAGINIAPGIITKAWGSFEALLMAYAPAQQAGDATGQQPVINAPAA